MSPRLTIHPERLRQFGAAEGAVFCLITNPGLIPFFTIKRTGGYKDYLVIPYATGEKFSDVLAKKVPEPAHLLVIAPECYFESPSPKIFGKKRKLSVMACNSTPWSLRSIKHFLTCGEQTDPQWMDQMVQQFYQKVESASELVFADRRYSCRATLKLPKAGARWHQQAGPLDWGEQQLFPAGEISTLPINVFGMDIQSRFDLNGDIVLHGPVILHSGKASFSFEDRNRIFGRLSALTHTSIQARLEKGVVVKMEPHSKRAKEAVQMLEALFEVDSRYRVICEIGFGLNHWVKPYPGNAAMNEVHAAYQEGTLHWGLGITPFTQYHLDVLCPWTAVLDEEGQRIFGQRVR